MAAEVGRQLGDEVEHQREADQRHQRHVPGDGKVDRRQDDADGGADDGAEAEAAVQGVENRLAHDGFDVGALHVDGDFRQAGADAEQEQAGGNDGRQRGHDADGDEEQRG